MPNTNQSGDLFEEVRHEVGKLLNEYDVETLREKSLTVKEAAVMGVADAQHGVYWGADGDE